MERAKIDGSVGIAAGTPCGNEDVEFLKTKLLVFFFVLFVSMLAGCLRGEGIEPDGEDSR